MELTSKTLAVQRLGGFTYLQFPSFLAAGGVKHLFTTRTGGTSSGCYASMNLSVKRDDKRNNIEENYRRVCYAAGVYPRDLVMVNQVHGTDVLYVDQQNRGEGLVKPARFQADGMITDKPDVVLTTFHADCVPVYFYSPDSHIIALVHSGWRGTVNNIAGKTVDKLVREYNINPNTLLVGIGPHIDACCFEVGPEVVEAFAQAFPEEAHDSIIKPHPLGEQTDKRYIDLQAAIMIELATESVPPWNITASDLCTCCRPDYFFSHRKLGPARGTMVAMLGLE